MVGEGKDLILQLLRGLVLGGAVKNRSSMVRMVVSGPGCAWLRWRSGVWESSWRRRRSGSTGGGADVDYRWLGRVEVELDQDWDDFFLLLVGFGARWWCGGGWW
jgi:hypothetical protein